MPEIINFVQTSKATPVYNNVALIVCPSQELERPPAAAAALSAVIKANGVGYKIYDFNLSLYHDLGLDDWLACERYWRVDVSRRLPQNFWSWLAAAIDNIKSNQHDLLAVSVFSKFSTRFAHILLERLRANIKQKIIVGGQGITTAWGTSTFGNFIRDNRLTDHIASGDGEVLFDRFLKGHTNIPGLDNTPPEQIADLGSIPYPLLDQINPFDYLFDRDAGVYVTASRGCVRKCKFCDVPARWPKYRYRPGRDVATEMFTQYQKTGVQVFQFTDSVINGVISEFESLQDQLIDYRSKDPNFKPKWLSQFNIRKKKDMPERIYRKMAQAGAGVLICGVEHASWHIRESMGKEFDDEDLDYHIKMSAKYGINNVFLMFIGYPTETLQDHHWQLEWLERYQTYMLCGTIMMIRWGYTGSLDHGSRLSLNRESLEIVPEWPNLDLSAVQDHTQDWLYGRNWINVNNPDLNFKERMRRRLEVHTRSIELGYPVTRGREELEALKLICQIYYQGVRKIELVEDPGDH
jgi:hypothetical protein